MAKHFTDKNFQEEVLNFKGIVVIDFWAEWCGPCQVQGPIMEALAEKMKDTPNIKIGKLNVDENPESQNKYQVMSIPTLIFFKDGEMMETLVGLRSEAEVQSKITSLASS